MSEIKEGSCWYLSLCLTLFICRVQRSYVMFTHSSDHWSMIIIMIVTIITIMMMIKMMMCKHTIWQLVVDELRVNISAALNKSTAGVHLLTLSLKVAVAPPPQRLMRTWWKTGRLPLSTPPPPLLLTSTSTSPGNPQQEESVCTWSLWSMINTSTLSSCSWSAHYWSFCFLLISCCQRQEEVEPHHRGRKRKKEPTKKSTERWVVMSLWVGLIKFIQTNSNQLIGCWWGPFLHVTFCWGSLTGCRSTAASWELMMGELSDQYVDWQDETEGEKSLRGFHPVDLLSGWPSVCTLMEHLTASCHVNMSELWKLRAIGKV